MASLDLEADENDDRSEQERNDDEAFERLIAGPLSQPRSSLLQQRRVSLLSSDSRTDLN